MTRWLQYIKNGPAAGRWYNTVDHDLCLEMLPAKPGETDVTHYVRWTSTDANGRPVDPVVVPRVLLTATVEDAPGLATVRIPTDLPELVVEVDAVTYPPEAAVNGKVVVELESRQVLKVFRVKVDAPSYYLPELRVTVTP